MKRHLVLFQNTRAVITAEKISKKNGITCTILPVPRSISTECGMAIEYQPEDRESIEMVFVEAGMEFTFAVWEK
jgi:hypothetical protein